MATRHKPLIVIVGETGSGKTKLALKIAKAINGEIIAADSRTVFKGLDIGTAKPSKAEQKLITHYLLDITTPDRPITVFDFKQQAIKSISTVYHRGKIPILVGGSGLYIDAVIYDYNFLPASDPIKRQQLEKLTVKQLQSVIFKNKINLPLNSNNKRHLIRALETKGTKPIKEDLRPNTIIIGLRAAKDELEKRLTKRANSMIKNGLIEETINVTKKYGWGIDALYTPAYKSVHQYLSKQISQEKIVDQLVHLDLQLAKKQRTWFKRNKSIQWVDKQIQAVDLITTFLNKQ
jgi:tRNA dimethylallyltransferase